MIHVDVSKLVPNRAYLFVASFVPGIFFEISILLANPGFFRHYVVQARSGFDFGYYTLLAIGLSLAWIIGTAFLSFVSLIQWFFAGLYRFKTFAWKQFCKSVLVPVLARRLKNLHLKPRPLLAQLHRHAYSKLSPPFKLRQVYQAWDSAVTALLQKHYGIGRRRFQEDWDVWYAVLGRPTAEDMRGDLAMMAMHAAGWCGLAALLFAPHLRNRYYVTFLLLLILCGILNDWFAARRRVDLLMNAVIKTRALLAEFRDAAKRRPLKPDGQEDSVEPE